MMRVVSAAVVAVLLLQGALHAGAAQGPGTADTAQNTPAQTVPQGAGAPTVQAPAATGAAPPAAARAFTAPVGLWFNAVRPDRVADFEKVLGYVHAALQKSTDPAIRAQAKGWTSYKAAEPGPGGTVLYVFAFDPVVPGADYGLGRILADAYPDAAQLQEIWRLYQGAVTSGGSVLNLTPVMPATPPPPAPPAAPAQP